MNGSPYTNWFYTRAGEPVGPVTFEELKSKFGNPFSRPQSEMVWAEGMDEWKRASEIEGLCENDGPVLPTVETSGSEDWFFLQGDQQKGPVSLSKLKEMMTDRSLSPPLSMVWKPGMDQWKPIYLVAELSSPTTLPSSRQDSVAAVAKPEPVVPKAAEPKTVNGNHALPAQGVSVASLAAMEEEGAAPMTLEEKLRVVAASRNMETQAAAPTNDFRPVIEETPSFQVDDASARAAEIEHRAAQQARERAEEEARAMAAAKARAEEENLAAEAARQRIQEETRLREMEFENSRALAEELAAAERARAEAEAARVAAVLRAREEEEAMAAAARARAEEEERAAAAARARAEEEARAAEAARIRIEEETRALEIARARAVEEARIRAEQEARARAEMEAQAAAEARAAAAAQARAEEEARAKASEEARLVYEAEARAAEEARLAAIAQARAEEETRARLLEQAKLQAEEEARMIEAAARARAEAEAAAAAARIRMEEESRAREAEEARAAAAARAREEEEARAAAARARAEEEARWKQAEDVRIEAEKARAEQAARQAEAAKLEAERAREEEVARLRQAEEARLAAERAHAEEAARLIELARLAAERARAEEEAAAQARARAEEETRIRQAEETRLAAERAQAQEAARIMEQARLAAERERAEQEAAARAHAQAEEAAHLAEQSRHEARIKAEQEMAAIAQAKAEEQTRIQQAEETARAAQRAQSAEAARIVEQARMAAAQAKAEEEARLAAIERAKAAAASPEVANPAGQTTTVAPVEQTPAFLAASSASVPSVLSFESIPIDTPAPVSAPPEPPPTAAPAPQPESPPSPAPGKARIPTGDSPKHVWYYTCEGEREGPVTFDDLRSLATSGGLDPRLDMVWKKGTPDWKPAGQIESLFEKRTETPEAKESLAPAADPYVAPSLTNTGADLNKDSGWPGARRRSFILVNLLLMIGWPAAMHFVAPVLLTQFGPELMKVLIPALQIVPLIFMIYIGLNRLVNVGMSRWWFLGHFVPLLGLWVFYRSFACPAGFAFHKKMDGIGIVLAIVYWLTILAGFVALALFIAVIFGAFGNPELKQQILEMLSEASKQAPKR